MARNLKIPGRCKEVAEFPEEKLHQGDVPDPFLSRAFESLRTVTEEMISFGRFLSIWDRESLV